MSAHQTTAAIEAALQKRFTSPEWVLAFNVANGTGFSARRWADAVAMNTWPSRGLAIHGIEVKASRNDYLRELARPEKAEEVCAYCDHWWIATVPGVVKDDLPAGWGLLELTKAGKLVQKKKAPEQESRPITRSFAASMMRVLANSDEQEIQRRARAEADARVKEAKERIEKDTERKYSRTLDEAYKVLERYRLFAEITKEHRYVSDEDFANAVRFALRCGITNEWRGVRRVLNELDAVKNRITKAAEELGIEL